MQAVEPAAGRRVPVHRHVVRQHRTPRLLDVAARRVRRAAGAARRPDDRSGELLLADDVRRLQALRARRMPGELPHRGDHPDGVRFGLRATGRVQRLRVLRVRLSVRRDRSARGRRQGVEVHALLRPAARGHGAGVRQALPDGLDPVRGPRAAPREGGEAGRGAAPPRDARGVSVWPLRRGAAGHRRAERVLPARRSARGLQPAARPGGADAKSPAKLGRARRGRGGDGGDRARSGARAGGGMGWAVETC